MSAREERWGEFMISVPMLYIINLSCAVIVVFVINGLVKGSLPLMQKLYIFLLGGLAVWLIGLMGMYYTPVNNTNILFVWDAATCIAAAFCASAMMLMSLAYTKNYPKLPKKFFYLLIPPAITSLIVITNPLHGLFYKHFSIFASEVRFGPLFIVNGALYYIYSSFSIASILYFGIKSKHPMHLRQASMFAVGVAIPVVVNLLATFQVVKLSIAATPLAFLATILFHGIAVYAFNFLNMKPVAVQKVFDNISDCYAIISAEGFIVNTNKSFDDVFGHLSGLHSDAYLSEIASSTNDRNRDIIYNLMSSYENCLKNNRAISYEQTILSESGKIYYSAEITPVKLKENTRAVIAMFKDITRVKEEMQREQVNLSRAMERERLASLGQMIGGIAHNLKTPIMSISGSIHTLKNLSDEYISSVGDPEVTFEDHKEISEEMNQWMEKIHECCAYMSDIITTVKGLAMNMNASTVAAFHLDEVFKRVQLLMQNSLTQHACTLTIQNEIPDDLLLSGDINNLVQVLNNLVDNAADAVKDKQDGAVVLSARVKNGEIHINVIDNGTGIPESVKKRLFKEMVTSKGAMGTGIGLYTSNTLIKGRFGGRMWIDDNPAGGTVIGIAIPIEQSDEANAEGGAAHA